MGKNQNQACEPAPDQALIYLGAQLLVDVVDHPTVNEGKMGEAQDNRKDGMVAVNQFLMAFAVKLWSSVPWLVVL